MTGESFLKSALRQWRIRCRRIELMPDRPEGPSRLGDAMAAELLRLAAADRARPRGN